MPEIFERDFGWRGLGSYLDRFLAVHALIFEGWGGSPGFGFGEGDQVCVARRQAAGRIGLGRFALYGQFNGGAVHFVLVALTVLLGLAIYGYNPVRGMMVRKNNSFCAVIAASHFS